MQCRAEQCSIQRKEEIWGEETEAETLAGSTEEAGGEGLAEHLIILWVRWRLSGTLFQGNTKTALAR